MLPETVGCYYGARAGPRARTRAWAGPMALPTGKAYFFKGEPLNGKAHFLMWEQLCGSLSKGYLGAPPTDTAGSAKD